MLIGLPNELQLMVMAFLPDISSLQNLTQAHKSFAQLFESFFAYVLPNVVADNMPCNVQELAYGLASAQDSALCRDETIFFCSRRKRPSQ